MKIGNFRLFSKHMFHSGLLIKKYQLFNLFDTQMLISPRFHREIASNSSFKKLS